MRLIQSINQFDVRMFLACVNTRHQQQLSRVARTVSKTGDGYLQLGLPLLVYALGVDQGLAYFSAVLISFAAWLPTYWVLKNTCRRRRPPQAIPAFCASIIASDEFSFPSGHTAAAFLLTTMSVLFFGAIAVPMFIWATAIAASRVILGVHFPTDTLAGASLGIAIAHLGHSITAL
jgi:undecaprenyl-diphosphatase